MDDILLKVNNLTTTFHVPGGGFWNKLVPLHAVRDVSLTLNPGETLGVVGESGCGKSTLGRSILHLIEDYEGDVIFEGKSLRELSKSDLRLMRKDMQIIFQDPLASLNPRMTVGQIIAEPLKSFMPDLTKTQREEKTLLLMDEVGLLPEMLNRYPHELSPAHRYCARAHYRPTAYYLR